MNTLPTDKTHCVILRGDYKVYITEKQAQALAMALEVGRKMILLDGMVFREDAILFILPANEIINQDKVKRGDWKCELNYWHKKGEECGHNLLYNPH